MEQDNKLKKILLKGSEMASVNFDEAVMEKVNNLLTKKIYYQPLVTDKMKKILFFSFFLLVMFILLLCLMIGSPGITFINQVKVLQAPEYLYYKIFTFILSFWIVFALNYFIKQNKLQLY
ncbi:MAG: hypothetical protein ABIN97_18010 [Ginsengibacter sp.]